MKSLLNIFSKKDACLLLANLQGVHVEKYRSFTDFLKHNNNALKRIAERRVNKALLPAEPRRNTYEQNNNTAGA